MAPRAVFLIIEGNTKAAGRFMAKYGSLPFAEQYGKVLQDAWSHSRIEVVRPTDGDTILPAGLQLTDFDGAVLTGSFLNITNGGSEVENQMTLARAVLDAGIPFLGSCWGLQLVAAATGGSVRRAVNGRELGLARNITRSPGAPADHPFLAGRPASWNALAVHQDEVETLPPGATLLASNGHSQVQAAEIRTAKGVFWGVQTHPEFDLPEMAAAFERAAPALIEEGFFENETDLKCLAADYRALGLGAGNKALAWRLGIGSDVLNQDHRRLEIHNWLDHLVRPALGKRGRG